MVAHTLSIDIGPCAMHYAWLGDKWGAGEARRFRKGGENGKTINAIHFFSLGKRISRFLLVADIRLSDKQPPVPETTSDLAISGARRRAWERERGAGAAEGRVGRI